METLVGRHRELQLLVGACKDGFGCVVVRGAPGVGKSRLLAAATAEAELLGSTVLRATLGDLDRDVPYVGLRIALLPILTGVTDAPTQSDSVRNALDLQLEDVGEATRDGLASAFESGRRILAERAAAGPLVVAVDDAHAADSDTVRVLALLVAHLRTEPITFLFAARSPGPDVSADVEATFERLEREGLATTVSLSELDEAETRALVHSILDRRPDDALVDAVRQAGRGNPFFVTEAVHGLQEAGRIDVDPAAARLVGDRGTVTISARAAMVHRVFELGHAPRRLVRVLTAMQRITLTRLDLAAEIADLDETEVDGAFDSLVSAGVLRQRDGGGFEFVHPIVRATIYDDIGPAERRRTHRQLGDRLRADREAGRAIPIGEIAAHVSASAESGDQASAELLVAAGREVMASAPLTAARWFAQAREILDDPGGPVDPAADSSGLGPILAAECRALFLAARPAEAAVVGIRALTAVEPGVQRNRIASTLLQCFSTLGRFDDAEDLAHTLEADGPLAPAVHASLGSVLTFANRLDDARDHIDIALADADDPWTRSAALGAAASNDYARGELDSCFQRLDAQADLDPRMGSGARLARTVHRASYLSLLGRINECDDALTQARKWADEQGGVTFAALLDVASATRDWFAGEWDAVVDWSRRIGVEPDRAGTYGALARVAELSVATERGEFGRARELADELSSGVSIGSSFAAWGVSALDAALGDIDVARERLSQVLAADRASGRRSSGHLLLTTLAGLALEADDRPAAEQHAAELLELALDAPVVTTLAQRTAGVVHDDPAALTAARDIARDHGMVVEAARADLALGRLTGDADALVEAHAVFRRLGAEALLRQVMAAMREARVAIPSRPRTTEGPLSDTELELARLVHEGLTNRQIARVLYLSPKTVEVYLSRVFVKTDCANRLELALAVAEGRLTVH